MKPPPFKRHLQVATVVLGSLTLAAIVLYVQIRGIATPPPVPDVDLGEADPQVASAIESAQKAVRDSPRSPQAWGNLGTVLAVHDFIVEAQPCFSEAQRLDPKEPRWPYYLGRILTLRDPEAAIPQLRRAVELCGEEPEAPRVRLAELLLAQGQKEEARQLFRDLESTRAQAPAQLGLARLACADGNWTEAQRLLEACQNHPLTRKSAHRLLAEVQQRRGDGKSAARTLQQASDLPDDPGIPDPFEEEAESLKVGLQAQLTRGRNLREQRRINESLEVLQKTLNSYPKAAPAWLEMGQTLMQARQYPTAEQAFREAIALAPALAEAHFQLGLALSEQKQFSKAAASFRRTTELRREYAAAHYYLGLCLERQDDIEGAIGAYRGAVRLKPHQALMYIKLGELLAQRNEKTEAHECARQALDLEPSNLRARQLLAKTQP